MVGWGRAKAGRAGEKARIQNAGTAGKRAAPCSAGRRFRSGCLGMGRYIDEILQPGEKILFSTRVHWMFYLPAILAWAGAIGFFVLQRQTLSGTLTMLWFVLSLACAVAAIILTLWAWLYRLTRETDVTTLRIVHKEGLISRKTFEMSLDKVESVDVTQSIFGRILNYGDVTIMGVGDGRKTIKTIASPIAFRNHITAR